jgi:hypothetical protein
LTLPSRPATRAACASTAIDLFAVAEGLIARKDTYLDAAVLAAFEAETPEVTR